MGEHGFIGFGLFMLLAWFAWNTGTRIRRLAKQSPETRWAMDLASMVQVSLVGYAGCGLFLGLAYFDYYYTLIAVMVICKLVLEEQLAGAPSPTSLALKQTSEIYGQNRSNYRSLAKK